MDMKTFETDVIQMGWFKLRQQERAAAFSTIKFLEAVSKFPVACSRRRKEADFPGNPKLSASSPRRLRFLKPSLAFLVAVVFSTVAGIAQPVSPNSASDIDKRVAAIVSEWESLPSVFDDIESYTAEIKELVEIGKPAVPALSAALD